MCSTRRCHLAATSSRAGAARWGRRCCPIIWRPRRSPPASARHPLLTDACHPINARAVVGAQVKAAERRLVHQHAVRGRLAAPVGLAAFHVLLPPFLAVLQRDDKGAAFLE